MDAIFSYLDNMFAHLPKTEEVKRAKSELGQMMEDKYNQLRAEGRSDNEAVGQVISEFGNLSELAAELGISNQYQQASSDDNFVTVTDAEAESFIEKTKKSARLIAGGIASVLFGVISVIFFSGYAEGLFNPAVLLDGEPNKRFVAAGIALLFICVAFAVYLFVMVGIGSEKYEIFEKKMVKLEPHQKFVIQEARENHRPLLMRKISLGVVLILLGVAALSVVSILNENNEALILSAVCGLLVVIAISMWLFISGSMLQSAYDKLLNEGDYTLERRKSQSVMQRWAPPYWTLMVVGYLAWSFITGAWHKTWIIWPIAGVLFGLISAIVQASTPNKE